MRVPSAALIILTATTLGVPRADAQGSAQSMDIGTSIRASGMGGASTAFCFGDELDSWANPALLGYATGLRYQRGRTRLLPGLATDVYFDTEHIRIGGAGVGLVMAGQPFMEGVRLDYGPGFGFESVESWGVGINALQATESILRAAGKSPEARSRIVDFSFGMNFKRASVDFGPGIHEAGSTIDWGLLLRVSPLEQSTTVAGVPLRLDAAAGIGVINSNEETIFDYPPTRQKRAGIAMQVSLDPPALGLAPLGSRPWFLEGLSPLVALGVAADWTRASAGGQAPRSQIRGLGAEATVLNLVTLRGGYHDNATGMIQDPTFGFAFTLPIGVLAGARYEQSSFPQASSAGLPNVTRRSYTIWVDPLAAWAFSRRSAKA